MEEMTEELRRPVWKFRRHSDDGDGEMKLRTGGKGRVEERTFSCRCMTMTYEMLSSHPRLHCGPASPHSLLSSESTGAHCPEDFHGPERQKDR